MATPSRKGRRPLTNTPSKRAKFRELFTSDNTDENIVEISQSRETDNPEAVLNRVVSEHGFDVALRLIGAMRHVPLTFIDRLNYIHNIVNCDKEVITKIEVQRLVKSLESLVESKNVNLNADILWKCSQKYNEGYLMFCLPPVDSCISCGGQLYSFNKSAITVFTLDGPMSCTKMTKRCKKGCGATYNLDWYSLPGKGKLFYTNTPTIIGASTRSYITRDVHELMCESSNHAFVSSHAFAEIYNSVFATSTNGIAFRKWVSSLREHTVLDSLLKPHSQDEEDSDDDICVETEICEGSKQPNLMTRKKAMSGYLNGELINEVHENPGAAFQIGHKESREELMRAVDKNRRTKLYKHEGCTASCKEKGCGKLHVIDACWKVCMPHCMYAVEMEIQGFPLLNYPNVCTNETKANSVFCTKHYQLLEENGVPTKKEEFLRYIGCKDTPSTSSEIATVDKKTVELSRKLKARQGNKAVDIGNAADYQGTTDLINNISPIQLEGKVICNKDTGEKSRLRQRSRGHFICVTGGGHIQYFEPIFKSESPSQVFLIVLRVMKMELSGVPPDQLDDAIENFVLCYDNMCQLDALNAAKQPLPFPKPFDLMWGKITKVIDRLHIQNHKNPKCKEQYNPSHIPETYNTMIAEQTFSWFSRFKKVANSMSQVHHLFYIHRNIQRRNKYTASCSKSGKKPLLPGINVKLYSKDGIREKDGGYEVRTRKGWENKTNFTLRLVAEVQHTSDTMYITTVKREDGVESMGYFALMDVYKGKDLATALNRSTTDGGNMCFMQNGDLARLMKALIAELKLTCPTYRKELVRFAGKQSRSNQMVINAEEVLLMDQGEIISIADTSYVWMGRLGPRPEFERRFNRPTSVTELGNFFDMAKRIMGETFGVAMMVWSAMYGLNLYEWIIQHCRHFNLPVLYGEPMVGKTLMASCGAWLNGCPRTALASRCTLPYVTSLVTSSTMPFVWDDPTNPEDVCQLAIDLGNAAVRGKSTDEPVIPKTACLVTANFNLSEMLKYFSRIALFYVPASKQAKKAGDAAILEGQAMLASAAFPKVIQTLQSIKTEEIHAEVQDVNSKMKADIRIVEGLAVNLLFTRKVLSLANRPNYMDSVLNYVERVLLTHYTKVLDVSRAEIVTPMTTADQMINLMKVSKNTCSLIKNNKILAMEQCVVANKEAVQKLGAKMNVATRINGKIRKMIQIPVTKMKGDLYLEIEQRMDAPLSLDIDITEDMFLAENDIRTDAGAHLGERATETLKEAVVEEQEVRERTEKRATETLKEAVVEEIDVRERTEKRATETLKEAVVEEIDVRERTEKRATETLKEAVVEEIDVRERTEKRATETLKEAVVEEIDVRERTEKRATETLKEAVVEEIDVRERTEKRATETLKEAVVEEKECTEKIQDPDVREEDDVLVITDDNFESVDDSTDMMLLELYAPWCGHCKTLAPEYAEAAKILKSTDIPVPLAKSDATVNEKIKDRFNVQGFPTLQFKKDGTWIEYDGPREAAGIVQWVQEKADPNYKPPPPPPSAVVTVTQDSFDEFINSQELILLEFYAPWCGHCKRLEPELEKAAQILNLENPPILVGKVDATIETELATRFSVTGYPTIRMFKKGKDYEYKGPREGPGIVEYMIQNAGDAAKLMPTMKDLKNIVHKEKPTVLGFFDNLEDPGLQAFMAIANERREDLTFGYSLLPKAREMYKVNPGSVVVTTPERFQTKHEPKYHILKTAGKSQADINEFIIDKQVPLVGEYSEATDKFYEVYSKDIFCIAFITVDWSFDHRDATQRLRHKVAGIAKEYIGEIKFAIANEERYMNSLLKDMGLDESGEDFNIGCFKDSKKYRMEPDEFDEDEIKSFLKKLKAGKLTPQIKSQPVPKKNTGPVKVIVGSTFEKMVQDQSKDVLIEFYAPWCGHCKSLEPIYKSLAKSVKQEKNLVIAKMDATANDVPDGFDVQGFPTIYFSPAKSKTPLQFEGDRTVEGFTKYLKENAVVSFGNNKKDEL